METIHMTEEEAKSVLSEVMRMANGYNDVGMSFSDRMNRAIDEFGRDAHSVACSVLSSINAKKPRAKREVRWDRFYKLLSNPKIDKFPSDEFMATELECTTSNLYHLRKQATELGFAFDRQVTGDWIIKKRPIDKSDSIEPVADVLFEALSAFLNQVLQAQQEPSRKVLDTVRQLENGLGRKLTRINC